MKFVMMEIPLMEMDDPPLVTKLSKDGHEKEGLLLNQMFVVNKLALPLMKEPCKSQHCSLRFQEL